MKYRLFSPVGLVLVILLSMSLAPTALGYQRISPTPAGEVSLQPHGFQVDSVAYLQARGAHGKFVETTLFKEGETRGYDIEISVGTPAQPLRVLFDTADNKVWVPALDAHGPYGITHGSFDPSKSSTFHLSASGGSTSVKGDVVTDDFNIQGVNMGASSMGLAHFASISKGNLGLAFDGTQTNPVLNAMVAKGMINTPAFSVYLDGLAADNGTLLFGGIDTGKFLGELKPLDMLPRDGEQILSHFVLPLTQFAISDKIATNTTEITFTGPVRAVLDIGSAYTVLPDALATAIYRALGATWSATSKHASVSCSAAKNGNGTFDFTLGNSTTNTTICVPFSEMVLRNGAGCQVGVYKLSAAKGMPVILGDSFLRSAYVVHDLANRQMALAQEVFNVSANASHVVEFPRFGANITELMGNVTAELGELDRDGFFEEDGEG